MSASDAARDQNDTDEARPRRARGAPCLWFTRLPLHELIDLIRTRHYGWLASTVEIQFAEQERLVAVDDGAPVRLSFHAVLNHVATPAEVFGMLAKRALFAVAAAARPGRAMPLPLAAICPEEPFADAWIDLHLGGCIHRRSLEEEPEVRRGWQKQWLTARPLPPGLKLRRLEAEAALLALERS